MIEAGMKDKLRELSKVERVRLFVNASDENLKIPTRVLSWLSDYADILDAEGDGGAVADGWKDPTGFSAEMVKDEAENWTRRETGKEMLLNYAKFLAASSTPQWENVMSEFTREQVCEMATNVRDCAWPADVKPYMELIEPMLRAYAALQSIAPPQAKVHP